MKKLSKQNLKFLLLVAALLVTGVGIAYAVLSTTLSISFQTVTQNALSWDVSFQGSSATATVSGTSDTGRSCGTASITPTSVTVANTTLSKPGDKCTYALTVANNGTVAAILNAITPTAPSGATCSVENGGNLVCGHITYKLTTDAEGETLLTTGGTLNAGALQTMYLVVMYNSEELQSTAVTQNGATFTLSYTQA